MHRLARQNEIGGATVEFALLTMLLVPMVIYTIYAGEALSAGIKAQEAEISAGWEITAYRFHDYTSGSSSAGKDLLDKAATTAQDEVKGRIKDFDSFHDAGHDGYYGVFGKTVFQDVTCSRRTDLSDYGPVGGNKYLPPEGWVGCHARVQFENQKAVTQAHDEWYKNRNKLLADTIKTLQMCGLGNTFSGCADRALDTNRGFLVFTGDWGLEDNSPTKVEDYGGGNKKYYNVGEAAWHGGVDANAISLPLVGLPDQGKTSTFKMGYLSTVATKRHFGNDGGGMDLHLSPYHEKSEDPNNHTEDLSQKVYDLREDDHYMGEQDKDFNKP